MSNQNRNRRSNDYHHPSGRNGGYNRDEGSSISGNRGNSNYEIHNNPANPQRFFRNTRAILSNMNRGNPNNVGTRDNDYNIQDRSRDSETLDDNNRGPQRQGFIATVIDLGTYRSNAHNEDGNGREYHSLGTFDPSRREPERYYGGQFDTPARGFLDYRGGTFNRLPIPSYRGGAGRGRYSPRGGGGQPSTRGRTRSYGDRNSYSTNDSTRDNNDGGWGNINLPSTNNYLPPRTRNDYYIMNDDDEDYDGYEVVGEWTDDDSNYEVGRSVRPRTPETSEDLQVPEEPSPTSNLTTQELRLQERRERNAANAAVRDDRNSRSFVIIGIPELPEGNNRDKKLQDYLAALDIIRWLKIPDDLEQGHVKRTRNGHAGRRNLVVTLGSIASRDLLLTRAHHLQNNPDTASLKIEAAYTRDTIHNRFHHPGFRRRS